MMKLFKQFAADESGAVTVDWVVLCAAICGLAIAVATTVGDEVNTAAGGLDTAISAGITQATPTAEGG